jgi:hypothetical protein
VVKGRGGVRQYCRRVLSLKYSVIKFHVEGEIYF